MSKKLVAFFSASGVTAKVAANLAEALNADLFEIKPKIPYTRSDLNWMNRNSRSTLEMKDRSCRPEIANIPDVSKYDEIFVGFPVWWYREPSIIDTFMESADFSGKKVTVWCTSGGSGLGDSAENMALLAPGAVVVNGQRFNANVKKEKLEELGW